MGLSRRQLTRELKLSAVRRLEAGTSIAELLRGLEVNSNLLDGWRDEFRQALGNALSGNGEPRWSEGGIAELERKIGRVSRPGFYRFDKRRNIQPGLVHHSDRGSRYRAPQRQVVVAEMDCASNDYTDLLKPHESR
jgi:transposase-like protein